MGKSVKKSCFFVVFCAIIFAFHPANCSPALGAFNSDMQDCQSDDRSTGMSYRVQYYDLHMILDTLALIRQSDLNQAVFPIRGCVDMHLAITGMNQAAIKQRPRSVLEFDAGPQLVIDSLFVDQQQQAFRHHESRVQVDLESYTRKNVNAPCILSVYFHSRLIPAVKPPWEDGVVVSSDDRGRPWIGMTCQTSGASSWWPCMDRLSTEPDSVRLTFDLPQNGAVLLTNGQQTPAEPLPDGRMRYRSLVSYPINLYNITLNIGHYESFTLPYRDSQGKDRSLAFHMLAGRAEQAKTYFTEAQTMMEGFEQVFGPYAFWRDGYKVVETPYWGMEHQSCVAYGNHFKRNKYGFDFILVHESAHEWWGNAVSACRPHDLWIHEGLATWSESRLLEWRYPDSSLYFDYMVGLRDRIHNKQPVASKKGTHKRHLDTDVYYKAAWMWHGIRHSVPSKSRFDEVLRQFYQQFCYKNLDTRVLTNFWCTQLGASYAGIFDHYLFRKHLPVLVCNNIGIDSEGVYTLKTHFKRVSKEYQMGIDFGGGHFTPQSRKKTMVQVRGDLENMLANLQRKYLIEVQLKNHKTRFLPAQGVALEFPTK